MHEILHEIEHQKLLELENMFNHIFAGQKVDLDEIELYYKVCRKAQDNL